MKRVYRITRVWDVEFEPGNWVEDRDQNDSLNQQLAETMLDFASGMDEYPTPLVYQDGMWRESDMLDWKRPGDYTFEGDWAADQLEYEVEVFDQEDGQT